MQLSFIPTRMFKITPNDAVDQYSTGLRADTAGTVKFRTDSTEDITVNLAAGEVLAVAVTKVYATGTTVTTLHGFRI